MSGFLASNASIIFLVTCSSTPVCVSHHSTVTWAVPPCAGAAVVPPAAGPLVPLPVGAAAPHADRSDTPASPAAPLRNLRRLISGLPVPLFVPMRRPPLDRLTPQRGQETNDPFGDGYRERNRDYGLLKNDGPGAR